MGNRRKHIRLERVQQALGGALAQPGQALGCRHLASDCRVRGFEVRYPERFIEVGIAEQDMVSMAAGLARQGLLPVVNSPRMGVCEYKG